MKTIRRIPISKPKMLADVFFQKPDDQSHNAWHVRVITREEFERNKARQKRIDAEAARRNAVWYHVAWRWLRKWPQW